MPVFVSVRPFHQAQQLTIDRNISRPALKIALFVFADVWPVHVFRRHYTSDGCIICFSRCSKHQPRRSARTARIGCKHASPFERPDGFLHHFLRRPPASQTLIQRSDQVRKRCRRNFGKTQRVRVNFRPAAISNGKAVTISTRRQSAAPLLFQNFFWIIESHSAAHVPVREDPWQLQKKRRQWIRQGVPKA